MSSRIFKPASRKVSLLLQFNLYSANRLICLGLRLYPPITGLLAKEVPKTGAMIEVDGVEKFAPGGTQIAWNSWGLMRSETIFGPDSKIFRPERWLMTDVAGEKLHHLARMNETLALCFGYGRFGCLGKGVATMELNKALIEVCSKLPRLRYLLID